MRAQDERSADRLPARSFRSSKIFLAGNITEGDVFCISLTRYDVILTTIFTKFFYFHNISFLFIQRSRSRATAGWWSSQNRIIFLGQLGPREYAFIGIAIVYFLHPPCISAICLYKTELIIIITTRAVASDFFMLIHRSTNHLYTTSKKNWRFIHMRNYFVKLIINV